MTNQNMKAKIETPLDKFLNDYVSKTPIYYKGVNLRNVYLVHAYILFHVYESKKYVFLLKEFTRKVIACFLQWKGENILKEKRSFSGASKIRYVFVCGFSRDNHAFVILADLIEKIKDKASLLIVTDQGDVYDFYAEQGLSVIRLTASGFYIDPFIGKEEKSTHAASVMSQARLYMDFAEKLYDEFSPKVVFTTQDYWVFDQCFVHMARKRNILTVTHMHGVVRDSSLNIFDHVFSDKIVLWGENHRRIFGRTYNDDRMIILGTSKYDYLLSYPGRPERNYITLAINTLIPKTNIEIVLKVMGALSRLPAHIKEKYTFMLKLHPALNLRTWKKTMKILAKRADLGMSWDVRLSDNAEVLYRSKLLIVSGVSSVALEAMICGVSVIEVLIDKEDRGGIFMHTPGLLFPIARLTEEICRRIEDDDYSAEVLNKHKMFVQKEISLFHSSAKEIEIVESFIKERHQEV
ncbi:MAG: hypothetical protein AB1650_06755 [Candidatus Omnitrophota bacterium]